MPSGVLGIRPRSSGAEIPISAKAASVSRQMMIIIDHHAAAHRLRISFGMLSSVYSNNDETKGAVKLNIEKISAMAQDTTKEDIARSSSPDGCLDKEICMDAAAQGTLHGLSGP